MFACDHFFEKIQRIGCREGPEVIDFSTYALAPYQDNEPVQGQSNVSISRNGTHPRGLLFWVNYVLYKKYIVKSQSDRSVGNEVNCGIYSKIS